MSDPVLGAADSEVERVLADAQRLPGSPTEVGILDLEGRCVFTDDRGGRAERALADDADRAVERTGFQAIIGRERRFRVGLHPVVAEVARGVGSRVGVEGISETERADSGVEVEFELHLLRQARRPRRGGVAVLRVRRGPQEQDSEGDRSRERQGSQMLHAFSSRYPPARAGIGGPSGHAPSDVREWRETPPVSPAAVSCRVSCRTLPPQAAARGAAWQDRR